MPVVWLIDAYRTGERGQVRALADALGWPCEIKQLEYRKTAVLEHVLGRATLRGISAESAAGLCPPWPDLVISSGVRNEPVCRWIREQSGGRSRYVHVGRPWGALEGFDLVVTTPQYRVPDHSNVVNNQLTLHSVSSEILAAAAKQWSAPFSQLPRPLIGVLAGGDSGPFTLGAKAAARLAREATEKARASGGSLLISTSSRTRSAAAAALEAGIDVPRYFYEWRPGAGDNPYLGILALADELIVTGDSIAMLSEAVATGKVLHMFDLGGMREGVREARDFRLGGFLYGILLRWMWQPLSRDVTLVHKRLISAGLAAWLGDTAPTSGARGDTDMQRAVASIQRLLGENGVAVTVQQPGGSVG
jgi:mitochondrial fission protein ELM1